MSISRRGFLQLILASGVAPAVVRAESLMRVIVPEEKRLLVPVRDLVVADASLLDGDGILMSGASWGDIARGKTVRTFHKGVYYHAYRP